jgi:hypothetical protein
LKRFRDDKSWIEKFRDDKADPNWLERFHDDGPERQSRPKLERAPEVKPRPSRDGLPLKGASRNIRLFEWLMYVSFAVEVATTASDFTKLAELAGGWPVVVLTDIFTLAFFGAFIFVAVYLRKKWALRDCGVLRLSSAALHSVLRLYRVAAGAVSERDRVCAAGLGAILRLLG